MSGIGGDVVQTLLEPAEALSYPSPARVRAIAAAFPLNGTESSGWDIGDWEEHYIRVFDMNPPSAPYLGYQIWGDHYQRGEFMAALTRAQREAGVDTAGELPDHIVPVLRYLAAVRDPLPQVLEILPPALSKIRQGVQTLAPESPYLAVLDHVIAITRDLSASQELPAGSAPREGRQP
jgi:nitrate reductase molybdenum cofactor assembly chaperone NarJ/NarW